MFGSAQFTAAPMLQLSVKLNRFEDVKKNVLKGTENKRELVDITP